MYKSFGEYYSNRSNQKLYNLLESVCEELAASDDVPTELLLEQAMAQAVTSAPVETPEQLLNEFRGFFNKMLQKLRGGEVERPQWKPSDPEDMEELEDVPQGHPYARRPAGMRTTPHYALGNREKEAENLARDERNMSRQRNIIRSQHAQKLLAVKKQFENTVDYVRNYFENLMNREYARAASNPRFANFEYNKDVLDQFTRAVKEFAKKYEPKLDMNKYYEEPDFSGVTSGLKASHKTARSDYSQRYNANQEAERADRSQRERQNAETLRQMRQLR